jgi:hypothetical protein
VKALKECHELLRRHTMRETADRHTSPTPAPTPAPPTDVPQDDPMEHIDPTTITGPVPAHAGHPVDVPPIPMPAARSPSPTIPPCTPSPGLVSYGSPSVANTPAPLSPIPMSQVAGESSGDVQMSDKPSGDNPLTPAPESAVLTPSPNTLNTVISLLQQAPPMIPTPMEILAWAAELVPMQLDPGASPDTMSGPTPPSTRNESVPRLFKELIDTLACASSPTRLMTAGSSGSQPRDFSVPAPVQNPNAEWIRCMQENGATQPSPPPPPPLRMPLPLLP